MIVPEPQEIPALLFMLPWNSKRPAKNVEGDVPHSSVSFTKKKFERNGNYQKLHQSDWKKTLIMLSLVNLQKVM